MTPQLRPYQISTIEQTLAHIEAGRRRVLDVLPTGAGKTVLIADLIRRVTDRGGRVLFLAGARELVKQTRQKLRDVGLEPGIIMAGFAPDSAASVQVASILSLLNRPLPSADLIVVDEADLARAASYERVLRAYPNAAIIGLTATPWRRDGRGLGELFGVLVVGATPAQLIQEGWLCDYTGKVFDPLDVSGVETSHGDYNQKQLGERATSAAGAKLAGDIIQKWHEYAGGRRTVAFCVNVAHSKLIRDRFNEARHHGGPICQAEHLDGSMIDDDVRAALFARVKTGETLVLTNCGVLTRGVDIPALEVAILARATKSLSLYLQMVGRVLRLSPETGKQRALILDHAGCVMRGGTEVHGLPDDERDYSLDADPPARSDQEKAPSIRQCLKCYSVCPSRLPACPACGHVFETKTTEQSLLEATHVRAVSLEEWRTQRALGRGRLHQAWLERFVRTEAAEGWPAGELARRFREKWGCDLAVGLADAARLKMLPALTRAARAGGM